MSSAATRPFMIGARWFSIPFDPSQEREQYQAVVLHTDHDPAKQEAHFLVRLNGDLDQYFPHGRLIEYAYAADSFCVHIATEGLPHEKWTDEQLNGIYRILKWLWVPKVILPTHEPQDGIGYHSQFPEFNKENLICPGVRRILQIPDILARLN